MRNPDTVYSLPMAICAPFWEFMVSAHIRWLVIFKEEEEEEESDAPPVVADNVRLVQLKIKKGGKVQLRPAKGLPPPRCRRAAPKAPKRPREEDMPLYGSRIRRE